MPLRSARQFLRGRSDSSVVELRKRVSADELEAEKIEHSMLFAIAETRWPADCDAANVAAAEANIWAFIRAGGHTVHALSPIAGIIAALSMLRPSDLLS
jgi:hypothetical protein